LGKTNNNIQHMLVVNDVHSGYGAIRVLKGISFYVDEGEIVTILGANGAGKTTLLQTISGLVKVTSGTIRFCGRIINRLSASEITKLGISHIPQGRMVFPRFTIKENLMIGAFTRSDKKGIKEDYKNMLERFPILAKRENMLAGYLSGGEQQILVISRAIMSRAKLLIMDEPSLGLSPLAANECFKIITEINRQGTTILLVEQNATKALKIALRGYVFAMGTVALEGKSDELTTNEAVIKAYLGGG